MALWRRLGIVASCLLIAAGAVILVAHFVQARQPGQASSGSVTVSQAQLIEQQLAQASTLNQKGSTKAALVLYDKVLSEDPSNPTALAYAGFLQWNVGSTAHVASLIRIGRAEIETAVKDSPTYYQAHLFYGLVLENQDHNHAAAVAQFNDFLADDPPAASCPRSLPLVSRRLQGGGTPGSRRLRSDHDHDHDRQPRSARRSATTRAKAVGERGAVVVGRRPPDADPQRVAGVDAHGLEHGRRLDALRRAGRTRMDGDARPVQPDEHRLSLDAVHAEADQVGEPRLGAGPDDLDPLDRQGGVDDGADLSSRRRRLRLHRSARPVSQCRRRGTEGEEGRKCLQPGAAPALLLAAHQEGLEPAPAPDDQRAGTGHPTELVRTDADQVGIERRRGPWARDRRPRRRRRGP